MKKTSNKNASQYVYKQMEFKANNLSGEIIHSTDITLRVLVIALLSRLSLATITIPNTRLAGGASC